MYDLQHTPEPPVGMAEVTKDQFFAAIGPLNVSPRSERQETRWETPRRELIGYSRPGYMCEGPAAWFVRASLARGEG